MSNESILGIVTNNNDPARAGAVKVALNVIGGEEYPEWMDYISPSGFFSAPEVGDVVEVSIPQDDSITEFSDNVRCRGVLTTGQTGFPDDFKQNYPFTKGIYTKQGHKIILDDKTFDLKIKTANLGHEINLLGDGSISIKSGSSQTNITIEKDGSVKINASKTDLNVSANDYLLKGTTFFTNFVTTFLNAWSIAIADTTLPITDANWGAYKTAMKAFILQLLTDSANWVSTTTRTS